jgi:hypothetical protein
MSKPKFVYVTYIRTTPEKLWAALTDPQTIRKYWFGITAEWDGKFIEAASGGWPKVLSNLKSLLETGDVAFETKT